MDTGLYWSKKISKYSTQSWASKPSLFAEECVRLLPKGGELLELGCGYGNDGLWFKKRGFNVTQSDLEDYRSDDTNTIPFLAHDLRLPLKVNKKFDVIYAHLSLHYFTEIRSESLMNELHDILSEDGVIAFLVNSAEDPESGTGEKVEENFYRIGGIEKRFFTINFTKQITQTYFEPLLLDDNGTSYKDREDGLVHLIRFVGRKI